MSSPIEVSSIGRFAQRALLSGEAHVIAAFERSCYVETPAGLACVGAVGNGPLNAHCAFLPGGIAVGDTLRINLAGAGLWQPRPAPPWDAPAMTATLAHLRLAARGRLPQEGFACVLDPDRERAAAVKALARWLAAPEGTPQAAAGLIGLGPGLTPSGDDLIGGALCALHATGRGEVAARLAAWVLPLAKNGTNRISQAHLTCAAEGECGEAVNDAIVTLIRGGLPDLARIGAIGHTSGWDALAGAVLALEDIG